MILKKLYVRDGKICEFQKGLNFIIGVNKNHLDSESSSANSSDNEPVSKVKDTNGIGKTTIVNSINYLLGGDSGNSFVSNYFVENRVWNSLELGPVDNDDENFVISRPLWAPLSAQCVVVFEGTLNDFITLKREKNINFKSIADVGALNRALENCSDKIKVLNVDEFKSEISRRFKVDYSKSNKLSALLDYISRDEEKGFNEIISRHGRKEWVQQKSIQYLFGIPSYIEEYSNKYRDKSISLKASRKVAEAFLKEHSVKDSSSVANQKIQMEKKLKIAKNKVGKVNLNASIESVRHLYKKERENLISINNEISAKEASLKNLKANLQVLNDKEKSIPYLLDIQNYFEDLLGYFPEKVSENINEYNQFFENVFQDRCDYYEKTVDEFEAEISILKKEKTSINKSLRKITSTLNSSEIVEDISIITKEVDSLESKLKSLSQCDKKLDDLDKIDDDIDKALSDRDEIISKGKRFEKKGRKQRELIIRLFNDLVESSYKTEDGVLDFTYIDELKSTYAGRTVISCSIPSHYSKGRNHAKICLFDYTWFLRGRVKSDFNPMFLIHDGPFSVISPEPKRRMLEEISNRSLAANKQYIVTINENELPGNIESIQHHVAMKIDGSTESGKLYGVQYD